MVKEEPYSGDTLNDVVQEAKEIFEGSFDNVEYVGDVEDITVDGREAKEFVFSCDVSGVRMQYQYVFLFIGGDVYVITLGSAAENYDSFAADFEQLLNGVKFQ